VSSNRVLEVLVIVRKVIRISRFQPPSQEQEPSQARAQTTTAAPGVLNMDRLRTLRFGLLCLHLWLLS